jgi:hypothetical protein
MFGMRILIPWLHPVLLCITREGQHILVVLGIAGVGHLFHVIHKVSHTEILAIELLEFSIFAKS